MNNKLIFVVFSILLILVGNSAAAESTLRIENGTSKANDTITLNITALNVSDLSNFDLNKLEKASNGTIRLITLNTGPGQSGDVLLSTLTLRAIGSPGQKSYLNLTVNTFVNSVETDIPIGVENGTFNISGSTLKSIIISPSATTTLTVGGSQLFSATAVDQNDNPITGIEVSWTVSNFTVGSVTPTNGIIEVIGGATTMFTALAPGSAMVNATNGSFTATAIVTVEKIPSSITFIPPTDPNNTILTTRNWTFINVSLSESGSAWLEWNGVNESMSGAGSFWYINKTGLGNGTYTYRVWANDSAGNENVSETRVIEILIPSLKGDLNGNGISADAGDLVLMKRASIEEIQADSRYDLNNNGQNADAGDLVLMKRASIGEIILS